MYQNTYVLNDTLAPDEMSRIIAADPHYQNCKSCLMQVFEPTCNGDFILSRLERQREALPKACIVGMTTLGPIGPEVKVPRHPVVSVLYFDESDFDVHLYDCHDMDPREAGKMLCKEIESTQNVQGVLLFTARAMVSPAPVIEELTACFPEIPVFGSQAGSKEARDDQSMVFTSHEVCDRGVLAVVLRGENLHVEANYSLGWTPLGREMTITSVDENGYVETIDNKPAVDVYRKYLGVEPDDDFYANVCAFPLLTYSGKRLIARVPTQYSDEGGMRFPGLLTQGAHVWLSYTKTYDLLRNTLDSANEIAKFGPQSILLFACVNRRVYMGNDRANKEFTYYREICPEACYAYGFGEILGSPEGGEVLNSTIVAVGMREGDLPAGFEPVVVSDPNMESQSSYKLLSDKLATFLEASTADLEETIAQLEHISERDQLTGIYNRRKIDEIIEQKLSIHRRRNDQKIALLMYDIDHFKTVNDTYGHEMGDIALKELTHRVQEVVREDDAIGRWGGEEFLVVVNNITLEQATNLAERLRLHVCATPFPGMGTITISIGVVTPCEEDTFSTLFERVDKALYEAKNSGRNCVVAH